MQIVFSAYFFNKIYKLYVEKRQSSSVIANFKISC